MKYSHVWHPGAGCQISFIGYTLKLCAYCGCKMVTVSILLLNAIDRIRQLFLLYNTYLKF